MYLTYLFTLSSKRLSEKNEHHHGGAFRRASSGMALAIETKPSNHLRGGLVECAVEGLFLFMDIGRV
jgi:hypothetical protein